ncbi:MAG: type II toxin-antitoxin system HipA family toxin [Pseudomonadales bacterium]
MNLAEVRLWGRHIGSVNWDEARGLADFEYLPEFVDSDIQVAPLTMPLARQIYAFPALPAQTFNGLPGLLADSLPDRFGNALIDAWLTRQGRTADSFNPVERLCYTGQRGMGALEYRPALETGLAASETIEVAALIELASDILTRRNQLQENFAQPEREAALQQLLSVGTSAGGARAKAVVAWNDATNEVRSGQCDANEGFTHWLLKFDHVSGNKDKELEDPTGYGLIELAYHKMALAAGIEMSECRGLKENGRTHFMTKRFDRTDSGGKLHMQSLGAMAHYDFMQAGAYAYEQAINIIRQLGLPAATVEQQFRRMAFNIVARNQDDHVKNIAFLMSQDGSWSLAPAFDVTYSYNPQGQWTGQHQMTLNGKSDNFNLDDFRACADAAYLKSGRAEDLVAEVTEAVLQWQYFAASEGVPEAVSHKIQQTHRTGILAKG